MLARIPYEESEGRAAVRTPEIYDTVLDAIQMMHWNYGKGDLEHIQRFADGSIVITARCYSCHPHTRRGRIVQKPGHRQTIHLYRHQMTVSIIGAVEPNSKE